MDRTRLDLVTTVAVVLSSAIPAQVAWIQRVTAVSPPPRAGHAMAYDSVRNRTILFGGTTPTLQPVFGDTWEWDGSSWQQMFPPLSPSPRFSHALAYDTLRRRVVLFGGRDGFGSGISDTWEWDGTVWIQQSPVHSPLARGEHVVAFDSTRSRTLLFGGFGITHFNDTWEWDGTDWLQRAPANAPQPRSNHTLAYDSVRNRVALFGGGLNPGYMYPETWEWDGMDWTVRNSAGGPAPRLGAQTVFVGSLGRVVLYGGQIGSQFLWDQWEWSGSTWSACALALTPSGRAIRNGAVYDPCRGQILVFGGIDSSGVRDDTWECGPWIRQALYSTFGTGCAGSAGTPVLAAAPGQLPWLGETFGLRFSNLPMARPVFVLLGLSRTSWSGQFPLPVDLTSAGMSGCTLYVSGEIVDLTVSIGNTASWSVNLCRCPELLGIQFFNQAFILDPPANPAGVIASGAGEGQIGAR